MRGCPPSRRRRQTFALQSSAYEDALHPSAKWLNLSKMRQIFLLLCGGRRGQYHGPLSSLEKRRADRDLNAMETVAKISRNLLTTRRF